MKFSDSSDKGNSLYHYSLFLLGLSETDTVSFPIASFTRSVNSWFRKLVFLIWKNTSTWEFDDINYPTQPIATTDLAADQQDYSLPTTALDVQRVEVLDSSGNYQVLKQFNKSEIEDQALTEYYETAGMPTYYDVLGNSLFLYPKPALGSVTLSSGLKLYLARDVYAFVSTDTDKEPGIQASFHPYMAYGSAFDYALASNMDLNRVNGLRLAITNYEESIKDWATKRNRDLKVRIHPRTSSNI